MNVQADLRNAVLAGDVAAPYERIGDLLGRAGIDFVHEVTATDDAAVLIFTPESDPAVAAEVDRLVSAAPPLPGWEIFGRRQRKDAADALTIAEDVYDIPLADARFRVVPRADGGVDVEMFTGAAEEVPADVARGMVQFFLEHAIGEAAAMDVVRAVRLRPAAEGGSDTLPPAELAGTIDGFR